jgi:hypothetical protein
LKLFFQEKTRTGFPAIVGNQDGSAIVIALVVLAAVTVIGVTSSNISITELFVSGNDVVKKASFFNSDAGVFVAPKVISRSIDDRQTPAALSPPFTFVDTGDDNTSGDRSFYRELAGYEDHDADADVTFQNDGVFDTEVDVERLGSFTLAGGGAEFGSGVEGHGTSLKGIRFLMTSTGRAQKNAETQIEARYLKVLGTAGGL